MFEISYWSNLSKNNFNFRNFNFAQHRWQWRRKKDFNISSRKVWLDGRYEGNKSTNKANSVTSVSALFRSIVLELEGNGRCKNWHETACSSWHRHLPAGLRIHSRVAGHLLDVPLKYQAVPGCNIAPLFSREYNISLTFSRRFPLQKPSSSSSFPPSSLLPAKDFLLHAFFHSTSKIPSK